MTRELYATRSCPFCAELRDELEWNGRYYVEYDVELDEAARLRLQMLTGGSLVPVLVEDGAVASIGYKGRGCQL
ncbi:MAG: hypothetical protein NVS2B17_33560 [Candidatus Velthaea sp.]